MRRTFRPQSPPARGEAQGRERDRHLRGPALLGAPRRDLPDAVPLHVDAVAFVSHQPLSARAVRIGLEEVAVAPVEKGVEEDGHGVVLGELGVVPHLLGGDGARVRVEREDADVERGRGERDTHLRGLARGRARRRLALGEAGRGRHPLPRGLVQEAVEDDVSLNGKRLQGVVVGQERRRGQQPGGEQDDDQPHQGFKTGHGKLSLAVLRPDCRRSACPLFQDARGSPIYTFAVKRRFTSP
jgi:hypothetical protein